ncbi:hypothetical protein F2Q69_00046953 [Brassica cretica]|uniref:Uncharacterized protein n=1 Tax=Brassica cretica TaxID=69181 RepID=A0A8S9PLF0_BRACR|nr:hypothetical protein F2Q69_00046953 [Brassica cretica]
MNPLLEHYNNKRFVQRAQRAINTSHVEAESKENGIGFVKLMSVTMRWMLHKLADMSTLLLSQHFILKEKDGFLEYIEKRIKVNGHMSCDATKYEIELCYDANVTGMISYAHIGDLSGISAYKNCFRVFRLKKSELTVQAILTLLFVQYH